MKTSIRLWLLCLACILSAFISSCVSVKGKEQQDGKYKIGDKGPAGGIVFHIEEFPKKKYYEIAPVETEVQGAWGLFGKKIGTSQGLGSGKRNTELLIELSKNEATDSAPQMCGNLIVGNFNDWFLPSGDELRLMYSTLYLNNHGDFSHMLYWSSSESKANPLTIAYDFGEVTAKGGKEYSSSRDEKHRVRAIRAFSVNSDKKEYQLNERGPAGGWIFYKQRIDSNSWNYLEAAPSETEFLAHWGLVNTTIGTARGERQSKPNTQKIIALLDSTGVNGSAAHICDSLVVNGFDDWFLPSADALSRFYENVLKHTILDSGEKIYWSSTETDHDTSLGLYVSGNNSKIDSFSKNASYSVRAIREFY